MHRVYFLSLRCETIGLFPALLPCRLQHPFARAACHVGGDLSTVGGRETAVSEQLVLRTTVDVLISHTKKDVVDVAYSMPRKV